MRHALIDYPVRPRAAVGADPIDRAAAAVHARLDGASDVDRVLADFIEDDLRESRDALEDVQAWLGDLLGALAARDASAADLVAAADDAMALERLEYLRWLAVNLRRRIAHLAGSRAARAVDGSGRRR